jgi:hypothetical protein
MLKLMPKGILETMEIKPKKPRSKPRLDEIQITGALATRINSRGRRNLSLTKKERHDLKKQEQVEKAVAMFLDLTQARSWDQIAHELGVSLPTLKTLTKTQAFMDTYSLYFAELGHDPRLRASQAAISDMLPVAIRELKVMLTDPSVSPSVRFQVIKEIIRLNGIDQPKTGQSDKQELNEFLKTANINVNVTNNGVNPYAKDMEAYVEGRYEDITSHESKKHPPLLED